VDQLRLDLNDEQQEGTPMESESERDLQIDDALNTLRVTYKSPTEEGSKAAVNAALDLLGGYLKDVARIAAALEDRL
jgi:hypothetical protein